MVDERDYGQDPYGEYAGQPLYRSEPQPQRPPRSAQEREQRPYREPAPKRRSRGPLVVAAVLSIFAGGAFAVVKTGVLHKKDVAPTAISQPSTASVSGSPTPASAPQTAATTPIAQVQPGLSAPVGGAEVGEFYAAVQETLASAGPYGIPASDAAAVPGLFAASSHLHTYWSAADKPTSSATCGETSQTLAVIETPSTPTAAAPTTVRVDFFVKSELAGRAAVVDVDTSGKIETITCVAAAMPSYPGLSFILGTYSKGQLPGRPFAPAQTYAPKSQDAPDPNQDVDPNSCSQYTPHAYVFYAPIPTAAGTAWRFGFGVNTFPVLPDLFVDPGTGAVERSLCSGLPSIPASGLDAAKKDYWGYDPAHAMVSALIEGYAVERSLISAGAKPTAEVAPYFASDTVFQNALSGTGKVPLLCTDKIPFWANVSDADAGPSGTTEAVTVIVTGPPTDGNQADAPTIGTGTYTVDLTTMKITGITCH